MNTKVRARTRLGIGTVSLDDYELKFCRLLRHSQYRKNILNLPKGVFLFPSQDRLISFPIFKQDSKPYQYIPKIEKPKPQPQPKKKLSIAQKIKSLFWLFDTSKLETTEIKPSKRKEEKETEEDREFWEEEEEYDNTYWEEWEEF